MNSLQHVGDSALPRLMSKSNEWYTPGKYVCAARAVMGGIELDPASCEVANQTVRAQRYYTLQDDGLVQSWICASMWLNPPYGRTGHISNQEIWSCKLIAEHEAGHVQQAVLLVNAATDTAWFQRLWAYPVCFTNHRVDFWSLNGRQGGPTHGSAFVYFGSHVDGFVSTFCQFGSVVQRVSVQPPTLWSHATSLEPVRKGGAL